VTNTLRSGYPLGALFVLITACANLIAGISPLIQNSHGLSSAATFGTLGTGALVGMFLGMIVGLFQFHMSRGVATGAAVGCVIGIVAGAMALLTSAQIFTAATAMTAGSGLIIAVAVMMRRSG
jgi:hypothetical protein